MSRWLLENFVGETKAGRRLAVFDKVTGRIHPKATSQVSIEVDGHSREIEDRLQKLESPAALAARHLASRMANLQSGIVALHGEQDGPETSESLGPLGPPIGGFRFQKALRTRALPPSAEQKTLAEFAALMFSRSPLVADGMRIHAKAWNEGVQTALMQLGAPIPLPRSLRDRLDAVEDAAKWGGLQSVQELGGSLLSHKWWLLKAPVDEPFILGDAPVFGTLSIGYDSGWTKLLGDDVLTVVFPFAPDLALLFASLTFIPWSLSEPSEISRWINEMSWKRADKQVFARCRSDLEHVMARVVDPKQTVGPRIEVDGTRVLGAIHASEAVAGECWRWRDAYRLRCGFGQPPLFGEPSAAARPHQL